MIGYNLLYRGLQFHAYWFQIKYETEPTNQHKQM
jgi:hypothetical protein